uniref:Uncharacterized protein n=1 Tax=Zea mays TaxID=4577 RepID=C0HIZ8_MAIZE|nr:unknown [Zea mays]
MASASNSPSTEDPPCLKSEDTTTSFDSCWRFPPTSSWSPSDIACTGRRRQPLLSLRHGSPSFLVW